VCSATSNKQTLLEWLLRSSPQASEKQLIHKENLATVQSLSRNLKSELNLTRLPEIKGEGEGWLQEVTNSIIRLQGLDDEEKSRITEGRIDLVFSRERSFRLDNRGRLVFPREWDS
jgi:hypothetical protein